MPSDTSDPFADLDSFTDPAADTPIADVKVAPKKPGRKPKAAAEGAEPKAPKEPKPKKEKAPPKPRGFGDQVFTVNPEFSVTSPTFNELAKIGFPGPSTVADAIKRVQESDWSPAKGAASFVKNSAGYLQGYFRWAVNAGMLIPTGTPAPAPAPEPVDPLS